jgi:hypothetical protein
MQAPSPSNIDVVMKHIAGTIKKTWEKTCNISMKLNKQWFSLLSRDSG